MREKREKRETLRKEDCGNDRESGSVGESRVREQRNAECCQCLLALYSCRDSRRERREEEVENKGT